MWISFVLIVWPNGNKIDNTLLTSRGYLSYKQCSPIATKMIKDDIFMWISFILAVFFPTENIDKT